MKNFDLNTYSVNEINEANMALVEGGSLVFDMVYYENWIHNINSNNLM